MIEPALQRLAMPLPCLVQKGGRPWEQWLTHAATAAVSRLPPPAHRPPTSGHGERKRRVAIGRDSVVVVLDLVAHGDNDDVRRILDLEQCDVT